MDDKTEKADLEGQLDYIGVGDVQALYADAFLVVGAGEAFSILFFQNQIPDIQRGVVGSTGQIQTKTTKCIARLVLSPNGFDKLLEAMAGNRGFTLQPRKEEQ